MLNPLTRGYQAIFGALRNWQPLGRVVRVGNFLDLTDDRGVLKSGQGNPNDESRPMILLRESRLDPRFFSMNATGVQFTVTYPLVAGSGTLKLQTINLLLWEAGRALTSGSGPDHRFGLDECEKWIVAPGGDILPLEVVPDVGREFVTASHQGRPQWSALLNVVMTFSLPLRQYLSMNYE